MVSSNIYIDAEAVYRGVLPPPKMSNRWNGFSDLLGIQDPHIENLGKFRHFHHI